MLQEDESVVGLTVTETSAAPALWKHDAQSRMLRSNDATLEPFFLNDVSMPNVFAAGYRRMDTNDNVTATKRQKME
jgi:hypothetical protein